MSAITGVLVDGHIFDMKKDMVEGYYFPNTLFPGATFKMVIDNDPANNGKVTWQCGSSKGNNLVAVSGDGTVTFPDADERCCDTLFYINATDTSGRIISSYLFVVKRFFKYSKDTFVTTNKISQWIESVNGIFPETLDVNSQYIAGSEWITITREVNGGLFQEWGNMKNSGWVLANPNYSSCSIFTFNNELNFFNLLVDSGFTQNADCGARVQAVAFYGQSRV
ncbi:hypothetical protein FEK43_18590 [Escherichia sp. E2562]|uniref:hypothetical protein n=2 Tax=Escherichia TaxID=561 RepID=UPI001029FE1B|nr:MULTISPECIES: hypothetical protein [unclassified Escherichia]RZM96343.1 hypothetical protein D9740_08845 [Escherichia sp. E14V5]RZM99598.1 hypothetical protein D9741_23250 [Escherichia sp. E14V7]RZN23238.1 hypothetical protein D9739_23340 [Escherichia sp. E14V10]TGB52646.1 hypothetical protein CRT22_24555 [Escherichia sp. E5028]TLI79669.1 hypothetical protein FEK43_18590 [Escherichia sp. E2562]